MTQASLHSFELSKQNSEQLIILQGFLDQLKDLLSDSNPMVVANAVAALSEINEASVSGQPLVGELLEWMMDY